MAQHVRPRHLPTQITHMYFFACRTCTVYKLSFLPLKIIQFGNRNIANYQNRIWQKGSCVRLTLIFPLFISLLTCMKVFFLCIKLFMYLLRLSKNKVYNVLLVNILYKDNFNRMCSQQNKKKLSFCVQILNIFLYSTSRIIFSHKY